MMEGKSVIAIVQARLGSTRLPGKVLLNLAGKPALWHVCQRLDRVPEIDRVVVATTAASQDAPLVEAAESWGRDVFAYAGDENDLLDRYISCGRKFGADVVVMVDGDCPLVHPPTISRMIAALRDGQGSEFARLDERSIEGGVAVLRLSAYEKIADRLSEVEEERRASYREHATLCIMERPEWFSIMDVPCFSELARTKHRLWLDTPADYQFLDRIYHELYEAEGIVDLEQVVDLLLSRPDIRALNAHVGQKTADSQFFGKILIQGEEAGAKLLAARLPEILGVATSMRRDDGVEAVLDVTSEGSDFAHITGEGIPRFRARVTDAAEADLAIDMLACSLGLSRLDSGYFQASVPEENFLNVSCPLCGADSREDLWKASSGVLNVFCRDCGHVYLARRPGDRQLIRSYRAYAQAYEDHVLLDERGVFAEIGHERARLITDIPAGSRIMDIGCGYGHFLAAIGGNHRRVAIEPSAVQARFLRRYRNFDEVWQCGFDRFSNLPPAWGSHEFDLVASFHCLEHLGDLHAFFEFVDRVLAPDGMLVVGVPDLLRLRPDLIEFAYLAKGFHLHSFHEFTLRRLFSEHGFAVEFCALEQASGGGQSGITIGGRKSLNTSDSLCGASEVARRAAHDFHQQLESFLSRIRHAFQSWRQDSKRVAIYGGGVHTQALFDVIDPRGIDFVVDDAPAKVGSMLEGVPILGSGELAIRRPDIVVASSLAAEEAILSRGSSLLPSAEWVGIYRNIKL